MDRFRKAAEARDEEAFVASVADDVVFKSPIVFGPYRGRAQVAPILRAVFRVVQDWVCVDELRSETRTALLFSARVGDRELEGIDLGQTNADGFLTSLVVFVRPRSAAQALAEAVEAEIARASGAKG